MDVTSIILAGGKNRRLGRNKALETIGGKKVIERVLARLGRISSEILIVTSADTLDLSLTGDATIIQDVYPDTGPLGGIYSGLLASKSEKNIVVACDMPFLNPQLLCKMVEDSGNFDAVVPVLGEGLVEPLHAVYSRSCALKIKARLDQNELQISRFLKSINVNYISREECMKLDPELLSFFNINRESDLALAREILAGNENI